jgi:hypothetical protein
MSRLFFVPPKRPRGLSAAPSDCAGPHTDHHRPPCGAPCSWLDGRRARGRTAPGRRPTPPRPGCSRRAARAPATPWERRRPSAAAATGRARAGWSSRGSPGVGGQYRRDARAIPCARRSSAMPRVCRVPEDAEDHELGRPHRRDADVAVGGSGEIRTHGPLRADGFQDRCNRPLCHASWSRGRDCSQRRPLNPACGPVRTGPGTPRGDRCRRARPSGRRPTGSRCRSTAAAGCRPGPAATSGRRPWGCRG